MVAAPAFIPLSLYPLAIGAVFGAAAMTYILIQISISEIIPLTLLLLLIGYTIFKPKKLPDIKLQFKNYFWVGIGSGALGILAGAVDPYLGAFFYRDDITKEQMVANKSVVQLIGHLTKIPAFIALGFAFSDYIGIILILGLTAIITTKVGIYCLEQISQKLFRTLLWWALFSAFCVLAGSFSRKPSKKQLLEKTKMTFSRFFFLNSKDYIVKTNKKCIIKYAFFAKNNRFLALFL